MVLRPSMRTLIIVLAGNWVFGTGHALAIASGLGVSPWTTLAQGIALQTHWSIGTAVLVLGLVVLALWIPLRERPGLGTLFNVVIVSVAIDVMLPYLPTPQNQLLGIVQVIAGIILNGIGCAFYLTGNLGPGPRDGLMTGLQRITRIPIARVRTCLEISVLVAGWLLGGVVGIGTLLFAFGIGPVLAVCLSWVTRLDQGICKRSASGRVR